MRRTIRALAAAAMVSALSPIAPAGAGHGGLHVTTPYPAVAVKPGESTTFEVRVTGPPQTRVELRVSRKPKGWDTTLRGGGFVVDGVTVDPKNPPTVQLEVDVPGEVKGGRYRVVLVGTSSAGSDTLELDLRVSEGASGSIELSSEFPQLRGSADATYAFDVSVVNNTPQELSLNLTATGPEGWIVEAKPTGQELAATLTVAGGETGTVNVSADPPDDVTADAYPIALAVAGGGQEASLDLEVEITGSYSFTVTTPQERLNADVQADRSTEIELVVRNEGSAPLRNVELSATPPAQWEVAFEPPVIEVVQPGSVGEVTAIVRPASGTPAGDYVVTIDARVPEASSSVELRTTVKTSGLWGFIGLLLIVGAVAGLGWVFRTYGRR